MCGGCGDVGLWSGCTSKKLWDTSVPGVDTCVSGPMLILENAISIILIHCALNFFGLL